MSASSRLWGASRALAIRSRPHPVRAQSLFVARPVQRFYADDARTQHLVNDKPNSPAQASSPNPGKDASAADAMNALKQETFGSSIETIDDATLEQIFYGGRTVTSEGDAGLTSAQQEVLYRDGMIPSPEEAEALVNTNDQSNDLVQATGDELENPGHKFGLPPKPYPEGYNLKKRYHPVLEQISRLMMKDGKLSVAQRNLAMVMNFLRTAPAPIYSPKFPLLPGTPPASHLPLDPVLYLTVAIDSVAPLLKVRAFSGAAGGGRALEVPIPLALRQRRRTAFKWILDAVNKRPALGSGRKQFPHRVAEEIIAVVEGRSGVWDRRKTVHKLGTASRANVTNRKLKTKKGKR